MNTDEMKLPVVNLPASYTQLLRGGPFMGSSTYDRFMKSLKQDIPFKHLFEGLFPETKLKMAGPEKFGWINIKEKLGVAYLEKMRSNSFYTEIQSELLKEVLYVENALAPFTMDGHNRAFLLGFYLQASKLRKGINEYNLHSILDPKVVDTIIPFLGYSKIKVHKIDLITLLLWHYKIFLGNDKLTQLLKDNSSHSDIFNKLDDSGQKILVNNILSYCISIGEEDLFYAPVLL